MAVLTVGWLSCRQVGWFLALFLAVLGFSGCAAVFSSGEGDGDTVGLRLGVVERFVYALGKSGDSRLIRLWVPDGLVEVQGLGVIAQGRTGLREFFGYCREVKSELVMLVPVVQGETVFCRLEERNEWLGLLGMDRAVYEGRFVVKERRIAEMKIVPAPETRLVFIGQGLSFWRWLQEEEPGRVAELLPDGKFRFTAENGRTLIELIARWRGLN